MLFFGNVWTLWALKSILHFLICFFITHPFYFNSNFHLIILIQV
jgi:hypothetical protein